jgi:hypothetical protein
VDGVEGAEFRPLYPVLCMGGIWASLVRQAKILNRQQNENNGL